MQINPPLPSRFRASARTLRRAQTDAETELWFHLRAGRLDGLKFRRQHPVPPYVVDFYCEFAKLIVELDGSQHCETVDASRSAELERRGLRIVRFWNNDFIENMEAVLLVILNAARSPTLTPTPLPMGEWLKQVSE